MVGLPGHFPHAGRGSIIGADDCLGSEGLVQHHPVMRPTLWVICAIFAAACAPASPMTPSPGETGGRPQGTPKRIVAVALGEPATFNAKVNAVQIPAPGADVLEDLVSAGFARGDGRGELAPLLAEAVPTLENGLWKLFPDGRMETTWRIRPAARWHDGAPFTADDVLFSKLPAQDRELSVLRDSTFDLVEALEAPDSHTVVVKWREPYIDADQIFAKNLLPKHLLERAYLEDRATFAQLPYWNQEFVGTGAYKLREWAVGGYVVLDAFEQYVLGRPRIDEIEVRFISDANTVLANLLAGTVDLTIGRGLSIEQAVLLRDQWRDGRTDLGFINTWLVVFPQFVNPNPAVMLDVRFRKALMHAIDRQALADSIQYGMVPVGHSFLGPNQPQYQEIEARIVRYELDPRKAAQVIEDLGYRKGADGVYRDGGNQRLSFELRTVPTDISSKTMFAVADYWQRLGIAVDPVVIPVQRQRDQEYVATFPGFTLFRQPLDVRRLKALRSSEAPLPENNFRVTGNNARYMNAEFDALIERFHVTVPVKERTEVLGQIISHIADQLPMLGLFYDGEPVFINNRLEKATGKTLRSTQAWNAHQWDVK